MADLVCPLCNGLLVLEQDCPNCGDPVQDGGQMENFYDPYHAYEDEELVAVKGETSLNNLCWHLIYCGNCSWDSRLPVAKQQKP